MRNKRTTAPIVLFFVLLLCFSLQGYADTSTAVSLGEKAGELKKPAGDISFAETCLKTTDADGKICILNPFGENSLGEAYDGIEQYGDGSGLILATKYEALPNFQSLVKADGTVLVENAAIIRGIGGSKNVVKWRYAEVVFATEEVADQEDCFVFSYKPEAFIDVRLSPGDGDVMYAGYSMIYDTLKEQFVGQLRIDDPGYTISAVGNNVFVDCYVENDIEGLYDPDGNRISAPEGLDIVGDYLIRKTEDDRYAVFDENLKELATVDFRPNNIFAGGTAFTNADDKPYHVIDANGKEISPMAFNSIGGEEHSFLIGNDSDSNNGVITTGGKTIIDFTEEVRLVNEQRSGFYNVNYKNGDYAVLYPDGRVCKLVNRMDSYLIAYKSGEANKCQKIFILNQADYANTADLGLDGWIESIGPMMFMFRNEDRRGLYSAADGTELISPDEGYRAFSWSNGYIYADKGESWDIYPCTITIE